MFRSADLVLVNKVDLLEHLDFDLEQFLGNLDTANSGVNRILTSARMGRGVLLAGETRSSIVDERHRSVTQELLSR